MPQVPAGWKETTLGEVVEFIDWDRGKNYPNWDDFKTTWFCVFLNAKNLPNRIFDFSETMFISEEKDLILRKGKLKRWDYVMTTRWTIGNFAYYNDKVLYSNMRINSWMVIIRVYKDLINEKFLWLFFSSNIFKYYLSWFTSWSAVPQLPIKDIKQLPIHLPPLLEQQAIAAVLSSFDDKIELLRAENQTLEQMGQELFKERFGKWKVGDELPERWRVGKLGEKNFAEIIGSWIERFDREKIYLATADVINSSISNSNTKITYQDRPSRANMQPTEKSIWFAKMQDSRKLLMFDDYSQDEIENYILSTWFAGIKTSELSHYYLWCFVLSDDFDMIKNNMANGAVQIAVNNSNLEKIEILIPNEEFLRKFNEFVKPLFKKIYLNNKQITSLSATCDQLLPKLMSGEVRVEF